MDGFARLEGFPRRRWRRLSAVDRVTWRRLPGRRVLARHLPEGTLLHVRVNEALAAELAPYGEADRAVAQH